MKRSRAISIAFAVGLSVALILATGLTANGAVGKKTYTATLTPTTVVAGSTVEYTLTVKNTATTQSLGSCNLTAAPGFTLGEVTSQPAIGTATITPDKKVLQLRNLSTLPMTQRVTKFTATAATTPGPYTWPIECRQANNYSPDQPSNKFTTTSQLVTEVESAPTSATFAVAFVDADPATDGVQRDAPDPVTGGGYVHYVVRISNTGTGAGSAAFTDQTSKGTIEKIEGCTPSGIGTPEATCTVGPIAAGGFADVAITVQVPTVPSNDSTTNTASVGSAQDSEETVIVPPVEKCDGYDCVTTWHEPSLGLNVCTGTPDAGNPLAGCLIIPPSNLGTAGLLSVTEQFDANTCGGRTCSGTLAAGNVFEHFVLPAACGFRLCTIEDRYHASLIPDLATPQTAALIAEGFYEDDFGNVTQLAACGSSAFTICRNGSSTTSSTVTFFMRASAGDGRTGYCLGKVCP